METLENQKDKWRSMPEINDVATYGGATQGAGGTVRRGGLFLRLFLVFAALGTLWAFATPLMAYPDEPSHAIRAAAVVRGQITAEVGHSFGNGVHVQVPSYIANLGSQNCYVFHRDRTADCAPPIPSNDNFDAIGVTTAGGYNPMYYWLVGLPSLFMTGAPAIYAMRIVSVLFSAVFFAAGFMALAKLRKPKWPLVSATIVVTPMVLFLSSGINPNSIEIAATLAAFCALLAVLDHAHSLRSRLPEIAIVAVSTVVLANTRSVSLLWLLCAVVTALMFFGWSSLKRMLGNRNVLVAIGFAVVGVVLGLYWMAVSMNAPASSGTAPEGIINPAPGVAPYQAFITMLDRTFDFLNQYIGVVGWLDTPVPSGVFGFWSMLFIATLLLSMLARPRKLTYAMLVSLAALVLVPAILQALLVTTVGFIWQGRYSMPLVLVTFVSAGMAMRTRTFSTGRRSQSVARLLLLSAVIAHVISFLYVLRRYVVGIIDISTWQTMISHPAWQPPLGWLVLTVLYSVMIFAVAQKFYSYLFPGKNLVRLPSAFTGIRRVS
ncbi:DUF2142 domain-containing protein [Arthrobacter alpinus]|uniref:DUF2142 domain-containing protein n=1 Tax=Arthrobacter alpinus TaxID=656366 RepID=UPI0016440541|nr:DUF2142 domain-containing protein [Arthrobacter alpinus]